MSYGEPPGGPGTPGGPQGYGYGAPPPYQGGAGYGAPAKPPTYRGLAITSAILGIFFSLIIGLPTGIVASVYGRKVDTAWQVGDTAGAARASRTARIWLIISAIFDVIGLILFIIVITHSGSGTTG